VSTGIAFTGPQLVALLGDPALVRALDSSGFAFAVAGIDRIDGSAPDGPTVDSSIAVAFLAERTPHLAWLAAAAVHRDHPYNLARRIASADHLSGGRTGLVLGVRDGYAPEGGTVWGGAGSSTGLPIDAATTDEAAEVVQELWQSYPAEAIVADRHTGIYARADRIRRVEHRGGFRVEGSLTVPTTAQGTPVLARRVTSAAEAASAAAVVDLLIAPPGVRTSVPTVVEVDGDEPIEAPDAVGVLLRPREDSDLGALFARYAERPAASGTLRERLGLPEPAPRLTDAPAAFATPSAELAH